jgi:DNA-nicking Smr family endonuclease
MKNQRKRERDEAADRAEMLAHLEKYGIARKDVLPVTKPERQKIEKSGYRTTRMTLDLHGLRSDEAAIRLRSTVHRCKETGISELLVIHGYGLHSASDGPVLKKMVLDMLENELVRNFRMFKQAAFKDGGDGATLVIFK